MIFRWRKFIKTAKLKALPKNGKAFSFECVI
jgi:hypothetical protein